MAITNIEMDAVDHLLVSLAREKGNSESSRAAWKVGSDRITEIGDEQEKLAGRTADERIG